MNHEGKKLDYSAFEKIVNGLFKLLLKLAWPLIVLYRSFFFKR